MTQIASSPADMRTMLKACAIALCCVPASVVAAKGLAQEEALNEGLIAISMANVIRKTCPSISARMLKAWLKVKSLEAEARSFGYTAQEVSAFVKDPMEKNNVADLHPNIVKKIKKISDSISLILGNSLKGIKGNEVRPIGLISD